jgi:response regulator RpfG family c-di-GMP phosphodiesterase
MDTLIQATPEYSPDSSLLIIDDDANLLKHLKRLFSNNYDVKAVMSAKEAFTTIKLGFVPGVIICDHEMPQQSGSKLLDDLGKILPNASKILLIKHLESKEIVDVVSESKAYLFVFKPMNDMEIIQSVKISFERFKYQKALGQQKQIITNNKNVISKLQQKVLVNEIENINILNEFAILFAKVLDINETNYYFTHKSTFVKDISINMADKMGLRVETKQLLIKLSEFINTIYSGMPINLKLNEVFDFTDPNEIYQFMSKFSGNINQFNSIGRFKKYFDILEQIFEHNDGTGIPKYITRQDIYREALIIGIANQYHNLVYRVKFEDWDKIIERKTITQSKEITLKRHNSAIKFIKNHSDWYTLEVFNSFIKILESGVCESLKPKEIDLTISL